MCGPQDTREWFNGCTQCRIGWERERERSISSLSKWDRKKKERIQSPTERRVNERCKMS